uniref:Small ribosomal subunit protein mS38 n=1 Tax=Nymphaea colorata TaxID=210225 RepID=A0A5K1A3G9_9MAGN
MANAFHRFLKKPHAFGLINATKLTSPLLSHTSLSGNPVSAASILGNRTTQVVNPNQDAVDLFRSHILPVFPLGVQLNPVPSSSSEELLEDGESVDVEEHVIRADSVKKKRKKKMNKHKYKKLRKRLRRKT